MKEDISANNFILAEIFQTPSHIINQNRFAVESEQAVCSGQCSSGGGCAGMLEPR
jgi:hypothetical protein